MVLYSLGHATTENMFLANVVSLDEELHVVDASMYLHIYKVCI